MYVYVYMHLCIYVLVSVCVCVFSGFSGEMKPLSNIKLCIVQNTLFSKRKNA